MFRIDYTAEIPQIVNVLREDIVGFVGDVLLTKDGHPIYEHYNDARKVVVEYLFAEIKASHKKIARLQNAIREFANG